MKNYILEIKNKKVVIKEDVATSVTTAQIGKTVGDTLKNTAKIAANITSAMIANFAYLVSSIVTMFASEEVKNKVEAKFKERRRKITEGYKSVLDSLEVKGGDTFMFLFNPSLYLYDSLKDETKRTGGIIGENLTEFLDDPFTYVVEFIPGIKKEIFGEDKKEDLKNKFSENKTEIKRVLNYLKKVGIDDLKKLSEDKTKLKYEQRQALKSILNYFEKNKDLISDNHSVLKIGKRIILEEAESNSDEIEEQLNNFNKSVEEISKNTVETITKKLLSDNDNLGENLSMSTKDELISLILDILKPYKCMQLSLDEVLKYFNLIKTSLENKSFNKESFVKILNTINEVEKVIDRDAIDEDSKNKYKDGFKKIKDFTASIEKINNVEDIKKILDNEKINAGKMFEKISKDNQTTIKYLSEFFTKNFTEFDRIINSSKDQIDKEDLKKINDNKEELNNLIEYFSKSQKNIDDLIIFYKDLK